ncbi:MAG: hypothetical protein K8R59_15740 [Thermoanaerobaculales bacterium]|nr:hypothetical protein [Thermoanaerobaculales bacterium]
MNPAPYTEDTLVQQTMADYLERKLGWESVYAYNHEVFVPNSHLFPRVFRAYPTVPSPFYENAAA